MIRFEYQNDKLDLAARKKLLAGLNVVMFDGENATIADGSRPYFLLCDSLGNSIQREGEIGTAEAFIFLVKHQTPETLYVSYRGGYDVEQILLPLSSLKEVVVSPNVELGTNVTGRQIIASIMKGQSPLEEIDDETDNKTRFHLGGHYWEVEYRKNKMFTLKRLRRSSTDPASKWSVETKEFTLWDMSSYFGGSFVSALDDYKVLKKDDPIQGAELQRMKAARIDFRIEDAEEIKRYCFSECAYGVTLFKKLLANVAATEIFPVRWDGPGSLAGAANKREGVLKHLSHHEIHIDADGVKWLVMDEKQKQDGKKVLTLIKGVESDATTPPNAERRLMFAKGLKKITRQTSPPVGKPDGATHSAFDAVGRGFFGGRIENQILGTIGKLSGHLGGVHYYDICSAYPAQMIHLPSMIGEWTYHAGGTVSEALPHEYRILHLAWNFQEGLPFYPFPFRLASGMVTMPSRGDGWLWDMEAVGAGAQAWYAMTGQAPATILGYWQFVPLEGSVRPFAFAEKLYTLRQAWKVETLKDGSPNPGYNPGEHVLKLIINSLYGKSAQTIGGNEKTGELPPYHNMTWAGRTTAGTRAEMLRAMCTAPSALNAALVMTDGLFSTCELTGLACDPDKALGAWDMPKVYEEVIILQPGVYWVRWPAGSKGEKKEGAGWHAKSRGFSKESVADPQFVLDAWKAHESETHVHSNRLISLTSALTDTSMKDGGLWSKRGTFQNSGAKCGATCKRNCAREKDGSCSKVPMRKLALLGDSEKREGNREIWSHPFVHSDVKTNRSKECSAPYKKLLRYIRDGDVFLNPQEMLEQADIAMIEGE